MIEAQNIGIVGLGLIGGSVVKALKRSNVPCTVIAWDREKASLEKALAEGKVDVAAEEDFSAFAPCDSIFLCVPVEAMEEMVKKLLPYIKASCLLTDVGSTKGAVMEAAARLGLKDRFIGGHPLAGSEQSGYGASKENLFENAYYCLVYEQKPSTDALNRLKALVGAMGAIPVEMSAPVHDRTVAVISHIPHVMASLLVNLVGQLDSPEGYMKTIAAGGFKDITRIASSSSSLWSGICLSNREMVLEILDVVQESVGRFKEDLNDKREEELRTFFEEARILRNTFPDKNRGLLKIYYRIVVDVDDKPGIIARAASILASQNINIKNIGINNSREAGEGALEIQFEDEASALGSLEALERAGYKAKPCF